MRDINLEQEAKTFGSIQLENGERCELFLAAEALDDEPTTWHIVNESGDNIGGYAFKTPQAAMGAAEIIWGGMDFQWA